MCVLCIGWLLIVVMCGDAFLVFIKLCLIFEYVVDLCCCLIMLDGFGSVFGVV